MAEHIADFRLEDGVWLVNLADEPRVHTWGRSIAGAARHIREASELWYESDDLEIIHRFPDKIERLTSDVRTLRAQLAEQEEWVRDRTSFAVQQLIEFGLSRRDIAGLLDLSHQRVHQIAEAEGPSAKLARRDATAFVREIADRERPDEFAIQAGYSAAMTAEITGLTLRQLDYWARTDLVVATSSRQRYAYRDLLLLVLARQMLDVGLRLEVVRSVVHSLEQDLDGFAKDEVLAITGDEFSIDSVMHLPECLGAHAPVATIISLPAIKVRVDTSILELADRIDRP